MAHSLVFGGTFDPIHHGHLITAQAARQELAADEVILIPAFISPHKLDRHAASGADRLAMARLATQGVPGFRVYPGEVERGGPSFTIDTLETLVRADPQRTLTLLLGADQLPQFHHWHRIDDILALVQVAIMGRPNVPLSFQTLQETLGHPVATRLAGCILPTPLVEISATAIRARVAAGEPIHFLVPPTVEAYIREHGLYGGSLKAEGSRQ